MTQKIKLTTQALFQQISFWEAKLNRQLKRLKYCKSDLVNKKYNQKLMNKILIIETQIEAEVAKYKKYFFKKYKNENDVINAYNKLSKSFKFIENEINTIKQLNQYHSSQEQSENQPNLTPFQSPPLRAKISSEYLRLSHSKKRYMDDTFNMKVTRQITKTSKNNISPKFKDIASRKNSDQLLSNLITSNNLRNSNKKYKIEQKQQINSLQYRTERPNLEFYNNSNEVQNAYGLKKELQDLKIKVSNIHRKIDSHSHDHYLKQINHLHKKNKKMQLELKQLKQQNKSLVHEINQTKKEYEAEKKYQKNQASSNNPLLKKNKSQDPLISEWVKSRIQYI